VARRPPLLTRTASRALPYIAGGVARNLSSRAIADTLSAAGIGVRRQDLLAAMRYERDVALAGDTIKNTRRDRFPNPDRLPFALHPAVMRRSYAFIVEVRGESPELGSITSYVTVSSDDNLTPARIEELATDAIEENAEEYGGVEVTGAVVVGAKRR